MGKRIFLIIILLIFLICCSGIQGMAENILQVDGASGWTNYLEIPEGTTLNLVVLSTQEGPGVLIDQYPDGSEVDYSHYFSRHDRMSFNGFTQGRHVLSYIIDNKKSNPVVIDVAPACCYDGNPCTIDRCSPTGCVHAPLSCDDRNPCTIDKCSPKGCIHVPV